MRLVIADTGPINYLILIGHINVLPLLFAKVILPAAVRNELADPEAPAEVRNWIAFPPPWLDIRETSRLEQDAIEKLDEGEAAAIILAVALEADLLLMDERAGVLAARARGLRVTGTLGVLDLAAERDLLDFVQAVRLLERTNFRRPAVLLETLLEKHKK